MPIITKQPVEKGTPSSFILSDKASLASLIGDSYYSDISNWKRVVLVYKSLEGNQIKHVIFDATQSSPSGELLLSLKSRDAFNIASIIIHDFDGGSHIVDKSLLTVSEFDIVLTAIETLIIERDFVTTQFQPGQESTTGDHVHFDGEFYDGAYKWYLKLDSYVNGTADAESEYYATYTRNLVEPIEAGANYKVVIYPPVLPQAQANQVGPMSVSLGSDANATSVSFQGDNPLEIDFVGVAGNAFKIAVENGSRCAVNKFTITKIG